MRDERDSGVRPPVQHVTILDHISALLHARDRYYDRLFAETDNRHQQRFDAQKEALNAAFAAQKAATDAALTAADKFAAAAMQAAKEAVEKAETANEKRFESVNEFRAQLTDQANTFLPRSEGEQRLAALSEKLDLIQSVVTTAGGRATGLTAGWGYLLGAVGLIGAVAAIIGTR
jgi:crotonobetainyl-CoA:carnitine CoA-transferase CaiB-like acyl-CoA transferase